MSYVPRRLTRRQVYRRRRIAVFGTAGLVLAVGLYLPMTALAPISPAAAEVAAQEPAATAAAELNWPGFGRGAIGLLDDDELLASYGGEDAKPMASITKLVLALTVLDKHPLDADAAGPKITMTAADVALHDHYLQQQAKVLPMSSGQVFTERELLEISLIESPANYAGSLSNWAFGTDAKFVKAAKAWLLDHGLDGITVVEPTGLDDDNVATPAALVKLGRIAAADPVVSTIVGMKALTVHDVGKLENTNKLLGHSGVTGIKTGTLYSFGTNLLFSTRTTIGEHEVDLIGVVLGAPGPEPDALFAGVSTLLKSVKAGFHEVTLTEAGTSFASYQTPWGDTADAVAGETATALVWGATPVTMVVDADKLALGAQGAAVGEVVYTVDDQTITVPLTLSKDLEDPGLWWRLGHPGLIFGVV